MSLFTETTATSVLYGIAGLIISTVIFCVIRIANLLEEIRDYLKDFHNDRMDDYSDDF